MQASLGSWVGSSCRALLPVLACGSVGWGLRRLRLGLSAAGWQKQQQQLRTCWALGLIGPGLPDFFIVKMVAAQGSLQKPKWRGVHTPRASGCRGSRLLQGKGTRSPGGHMLNILGGWALQDPSVGGKREVRVT